MCGIAGLLTTEAFEAAGGGFTCASDSASQLLETMVGRVLHRGPDGRGAATMNAGSSTIGLGHTRLSIIDLSDAAAQPMTDPRNGNRIVFNGEIYNYRELRARLSGERWKTCSDTEVILRAYARWGRRCIEHLRGMFAFALWDAGRRELFIARDRLGIKPLFYYEGDGVFLFASELRPILATGLVPRLIDRTALWEYMAYQAVPAPRTMIEGVRALLPGHWMTIDRDGRIETARYWDLLDNACLEARSESLGHNRQRVRELLEDAVSLHLVSDVPVAAFLSGGIDSSAIVALSREAGYTPKTFSVVFDEKDYDEARYAREIAARFKTDHTELTVTNRALLDSLPSALDAMDHPTGDGINTYVVSRAVAASGIKVALSGLGGDEFFAGYPSFALLGGQSQYWKAFGKMPAALKSFAAKSIEGLMKGSIASSKAASAIQSDWSVEAIYPRLRQVLSDRQRVELANNGSKVKRPAPVDCYTGHLRSAFAGAPWAGPLTKISYAEARTYMHDVLLADTDQMSMSNSLEVRVPFLDHKLVEYLMGIPDSIKRPNGIPKRLLVESLHGLLPGHIVRRPKRGFTLPFDLWMRGELRDFCERRLDPERVSARGLLNANGVQQLWQGFLEGRRDVSWSRVWVLVALEEWLDRNDISTTVGAALCGRPDSLARQQAPAGLEPTAITEIKPLVAQ
jgi:asparagine synthase (glutamine-hydrolysing)